MPASTIFSFDSSVHDYRLSRTDFSLPAEIRREIMLQDNNYPNEETELFDEQEEHILRTWKQIFQEKRELEKVKAAVAAVATAATASKPQHTLLTRKVTKKQAHPLSTSPPRPPRPAQSLQWPTIINNSHNNTKPLLPQTRIQKLAQRRAESLRPYIRQYVAKIDGVSTTRTTNITTSITNTNSSIIINADQRKAAAATALEGLVRRLAETLFAARATLRDDVYAVLTYEQETGWPRAEIWMRKREGVSMARAVNDALEWTKGLLWEVAEEASGGGGGGGGGEVGGGGQGDRGEGGGGGGSILPEILRFSWHISNSNSGGSSNRIGEGRYTSAPTPTSISPTKAEWAWGDRSCHFGALDLVSCLADFPRGDLELGWFGPAENDGEAVERWPVGMYKKRSGRGGLVVCGGCCPPPPVPPLSVSLPANTTMGMKRIKWKGGDRERERGWTGEELEENARRKERVVKKWKGVLGRLRAQRSNPTF